MGGVGRAAVGAQLLRANGALETAQTFLSEHRLATPARYSDVVSNTFAILTRVT